LNRWWTDFKCEALLEPAPIRRIAKGETIGENSERERQSTSHMAAKAYPIRGEDSRLTLLTPVVASDRSSGVSTLSTLSLLLVHGPSSTPPAEGVGLGVGLSERGRTLLDEQPESVFEKRREETTKRGLSEE
jgi:hypothetical protein